MVCLSINSLGHSSLCFSQIFTSKSSLPRQPYWNCAMTEHSEDGTLCEAEGRSASDTEYTVNCGKCISGLSQLPGMFQTSFFHSSLSWLGQLWASLSCGVHRWSWASPNCDENSESKNSTEVAFSPAHLF